MENYQEQSFKKKEMTFGWKTAVIAFAVFGVIALIAGLLLSHARQENRDLKRLSDIKAIQHALELYFHDCNQYPNVVRPGGQISGVETCQGNVYLARVPADPDGVAYSYLPCRDATIRECAADVDKPGAYRLVYTLESETEGLMKGQHLAVPGNFAAK